MTDQTPAEWLADLAEDWTRNPFVAISNEGATGQEFLGHLKAVLAEHDAVLADNERLTAQVADTRAKLAAASRAVAATDGRDRATYWRGWDDCVTAVKGQLGRRPEPAQPPAVAAPDAQDRARRAQEGAGRPNDAEAGPGKAQGVHDDSGAILRRAAEWARELSDE